MSLPASASPSLPRDTRLIALIVACAFFMQTLDGAILATAYITWPALIGPVIGPVLGGFITSWLNWRFIPLLNVAVFKVATSCATWVRAWSCGSASVPRLSCWRLRFQLGLGWSAAASGTMVMAYFAGNLAMKSITTATLRRHGFRPVLLLNGLGVALSIGVCALFAPGSPWWFMVPALLGATGFLRLPGNAGHELSGHARPGAQGV